MAETQRPPADGCRLIWPGAVPTIELDLCSSSVALSRRSPCRLSCSSQLMVEVIFYGRLAAAGHEDDLFDPGGGWLLPHAYWIRGLSTTGSISLGIALVAGRKRVPRPPTGKTRPCARGVDETPSTWDSRRTWPGGEGVSRGRIGDMPQADARYKLLCRVRPWARAVAS